MFLNRLNEDEKKAFLNLAHYIARVDEDFSEVEQSYIDSYCQEMQIDNIEFNEEEFSLVDTLEVFTTKEVQKIVLLEVAGLIYSDEILHSSEERIINMIAKKFNIDSAKLSLYKEWAKTILSVTNQGELLLKI